LRARVTRISVADQAGTVQAARVGAVTGFVVDVLVVGAGLGGLSAALLPDRSLDADCGNSGA